MSEVAEQLVDDEALEEVLELADQMNGDKWKIGDALIRLSESRPDLTLMAIIRDYGLESKFGLTDTALRKYKLVAEKWEPARRVDAAWVVHAELIAPENRHLIRPGMLVAEAHKAKLDWMRARMTAQPVKDTARKPEVGKAEEDSFSDKDPNDPRWAITQTDLSYERTRFELRIDRALGYVQEIAENIDVFVGDTWPPAEWRITVAEMRTALDIIEAAIPPEGNGRHLRAV